MAASIVGAIIAFIRLEGKVQHLREIDSGQDKRIGDVEQMIKQQSQVTSLIVGIQSDLTWIKRLLSKALKVDLDKDEN